MTLQNFIVSLSGILASVLLIDVFYQPQKFFLIFQRKRLLKQIKQNMAHQVNSWIVVTGPNESGKTTLFEHNNWKRISSDHKYGVQFTVWQHPSKPVGGIEITINLANDDLKIWYDSISVLKAKKVFVCINPTSIQQLDKSARLLGKVDLILTHCEKIHGFSLFMKQLVNTPWCFKIPSNKELIDIDSLHDGFEKLHAQFQAYGNHLLNDMDDKESKRIVNDFPQHFHQLKFNLAKLIKVLSVKSVHCCGLLWQTGKPNLLFTPRLESGLELKYEYPKISSAILFGVMIGCISLQLTWYQNRMNLLWEKQSLTHLVDASNKLDHLRTKSALIGEMVGIVSPRVKLSPHQQDEIKHISQELKFKLNEIDPLIALLKLRHDTFSDIHKSLLPFVIDNLSDYKSTLDVKWNENSLKEQFLASIHYVHGHTSTLEPLPTDLKVDDACNILTNRVSLLECQMLSKQWLHNPKIELESFTSIIQLIDQTKFPPDTQEKMLHLKDWLQKISTNKNSDYLAFEFVHNHAKNPNTNHILNQLEKQNTPDSLTQQIVTSSWSVLLSGAAKHIDSVWMNTIYQYYQKNILDFYPINPKSNFEVPLDKFNRFYSKKGLLDLFFNHYVSPFLTSDFQGLKSFNHNKTLPITKASLDFFNQAIKIQDEFCKNDECVIEFSIKPKYENENWVLESAGEKHYLSKPSNFIWPTQFNTDGITIHEGKSDYLYRGMWGIWRWLETADMQGKNIAFKNHTFEIESPTKSIPEIINFVRRIQAPTSLSSTTQYQK